MVRGKRTVVVLAVTAAIVAAVVKERHTVTPSHVATSVLYVSTHGTDQGSCTLSQPCATIAYASHRATGGNLVLVERGVYGPQVIDGSGQVHAPLTIAAQGRVILRRPANASDAMQRTPLLAMNNVSHLVIEGFRIVGMKGRKGYNPAIYPGGDPTQAEVIDGTGGGAWDTYLVFKHLTVKHSNAGCLKVPGHVTVLHSTFIDCGKTGDTLAHGIYCAGDHDTIIGNVVQGTSGYGIHCHGDTQYAVIERNRVSGAYYGGILAEKPHSVVMGNTVYRNGFGVEVGPSITVAHNLIAFNKTGTTLGFGLGLASPGHDRIINNTFYRNGFGEVYLFNGSYGAPIVFKHNIVDGSGPTDHFFNTPLPAPGSQIDYNVYHNMPRVSIMGAHSTWRNPHIRVVLS